METTPVVVLVDVANVMGSRPTGWWRDRAGAARKLLTGLAELPGRTLEPGTWPEPSRGGRRGSAVVQQVVAVLEGAAKAADTDDLSTAERDDRDGSAQDGGVEKGLRVVRAPGEGDDTIVDECRRLCERAGEEPAYDVVVVTADRGLRDRLPDGVGISGPSWLLGLMEGGDGERGRDKR